MLFQKLMWGIM